MEATKLVGYVKLYGSFFLVISHFLCNYLLWNRKTFDAFKNCKIR